MLSPKKTPLKIEATAKQLASLDLLIASKKLNPAQLAEDNTDLLGEIVVAASAIAVVTIAAAATPVAAAAVAIGFGADIAAVLTRTIGNSMILKDPVVHQNLAQAYKNMSLEKLIEVRNMIVLNKG
ncbi:hypothetical protein BH09BAC6_BH09BAC6_08740 [soil metagenome]|jgi:hypothetical protein